MAFNTPTHTAASSLCWLSLWSSSSSSSALSFSIEQSSYALGPWLRHRNKGLIVVSCFGQLTVGMLASHAYRPLLHPLVSLPPPLVPLPFNCQAISCLHFMSNFSRSHCTRALQFASLPPFTDFLFHISFASLIIEWVVVVVFPLHFVCTCW